jgi:restriction system protein
MRVNGAWDCLTVSTRNSSGSIMAVFKLPESANAELLGAATGAPVDVPQSEIDAKVADPLEDFEAFAFERIKDDQGPHLSGCAAPRASVSPTLSSPIG